MKSLPFAIYNRRDYAIVINRRNYGKYEEIDECNNYAKFKSNNVRKVNSRILHYSGSSNHTRNDCCQETTW